MDIASAGSPRCLRWAVVVVGALLTLFVICVFSDHVSAATVTVNTDTMVGIAANCPGASCSLRDAVAFANANDSTAITFQAGLASPILLTQVTTLSLTRTTGSGTTITGPGVASLAVDGGYTGGATGMTVLTINSNVTVSISGLTIQNGNTSGGTGGGILNNGSLTLANVTLRANHTGFLGGGLYSAGSLTTGANTTIGGGIYNAGVWNAALDLTVSNNAATQAGGVGTTPADVEIADLNGDTKADIIVTNATDNTVTVLLNNGGAPVTFTQPPGSPIAVGMSPQQVVIADLNGDGKKDLAVANLNDGTVSVLLGVGNGAFTAAPGSPITNAVGNNGVLAISDLNGDGITDLAIPAATDGYIAVRTGNGNGAFTANGAGLGGSPSILAYGGAHRFILADVNGDGKQDIIAVGFSISVLLNRTVLALPTPKPAPSPRPGPPPSGGPPHPAPPSRPGPAPSGGPPRPIPIPRG